MRVRIPTPLRSYTDQEPVVETAEPPPSTVDALLLDLDRRYPGIRFRVVDEQGRVRQHMKVFVNSDPIRDLATPLAATDEVTIMQALSGG